MPASWSHSIGTCSAVEIVAVSTLNLSKPGHAYADTASCANRIAAINSRLTNLQAVRFMKFNELGDHTSTVWSLRFIRKSSTEEGWSVDGRCVILFR